MDGIRYIAPIRKGHTAGNLHEMQFLPQKSDNIATQNAQRAVEIYMVCQYNNKPWNMIGQTV